MVRTWWSLPTGFGIFLLPKTAKYPGRLWAWVAGEIGLVIGGIKLFIRRGGERCNTWKMGMGEMRIMGRGKYSENPEVGYSQEHWAYCLKVDLQALKKKQGNY